MDGPYPDVLAEHPEAVEAALIHEYPSLGDPVAAFWRGEITGRMLVSLINGLHPDSALHRAKTDGHVWTWNEALAWQQIHLLKVIDQRLVWQKRKKPKMPKWRQFPWTKDEKKLGSLGGKSPGKALALLRSLRPGGGAGKDKPDASVAVSTN